MAQISVVLIFLALENFQLAHHNATWSIICLVNLLVSIDACIGENPWTRLVYV